MYAGVERLVSVKTGHLSWHARAPEQQCESNSVSIPHIKLTLDLKGKLPGYLSMIYYMTTVLKRRQKHVPRIEESCTTLTNMCNKANLPLYLTSPEA
jgi:hypothetical protein